MDDISMSAQQDDSMANDTGYRLYNEGRAALAAGERDRAIQLLTQSADLSPHFKTLEDLE
jgi:hypothetical protein